ncbi:MAG: peptidase [Nitrospinaceae bacterium]|nr:peptidase [Nitrospinaceae bacterium]MBT5367842.1 peptidase [Nitrospinaceae bacterium]MBT6394715.1 peptidase [Nitrospinaceae bacterium]
MRWRRAARSKLAILFVFVDGMGLAPAGPNNPLAAIEAGPLAHLCRSGASPAGFRLISADARLGVPGTPQSATGGSSLFTGVNAPAHVGRHIQGYPNTPLRELISRESLLRKTRERGARVDFANAYTSRFFDRGRTRHRSVTTVMAESSGIPLKRVDDLKRGEAVYRDFTNRILVESGLDLEEISPEEAGGRLGRMARSRDLLIYEYFQTDIAGHRGTIEEAKEVLGSLNRFLQAALSELDPARDTFVLSSDHGNIEDMSILSHTLNNVPILLWGIGLDVFVREGKTSSILDVSRGINTLIRCY